MAVFTAVTEPQLAEWMRHYDLGDVVEFRGISSGIENSNFFLTTTRGEYVLTIFEKLTAEQLPFYLDLMRHLAAHRVPVPDPMPREDGALFGMLHGKPAAIVTKLEGAPEMAPGVEHCIEVGQMLARMHLAGRDYTALSAESAQPAVVAAKPCRPSCRFWRARNASCCRPNWRIRKPFSPRPITPRCPKAPATPTCSATTRCSRTPRRKRATKCAWAASSTSISPAATSGCSTSR